eukprot:tig00000140_g8463.t1
MSDPLPKVEGSASGAKSEPDVVMQQANDAQESVNAPGRPAADAGPSSAGAHAVDGGAGGSVAAGASEDAPGSAGGSPPRDGAPHTCWKACQRKNSPEYIWHHLKPVGDGSFEYQATWDSSPLWYFRTQHGWIWSPDRIVWIDAPQVTVTVGSFSGQKPVQENQNFIVWLAMVDPVAPPAAGSSQSSGRPT